jgi:hypothetical protein
MPRQKKPEPGKITGMTRLGSSWAIFGSRWKQPESASNTSHRAGSRNCAIRKLGETVNFGNQWLEFRRFTRTTKRSLKVSWLRSPMTAGLTDVSVIASVSVFH